MITIDATTDMIVRCAVCPAAWPTVAESSGHEHFDGDAPDEFERMAHLEEQIGYRKTTLAFADETRMPDYLWVQHTAALQREKAELFALVDGLTAEESAAYGEYRRSTP